METVTVSPKFQIVIPKKVREELRFEPGQRLHVFVVDGEMRVHRQRSINELRGAAKGLRWRDEDRDHSDRF